MTKEKSQHYKQAVPSGNMMANIQLIKTQKKAQTATDIPYHRQFQENYTYNLSNENQSNPAPQPITEHAFENKNNFILSGTKEFIVSNLEIFDVDF